MMKAGILSMQRIFNYGSFLQAYGLKKILEELGCEVEFADYHPGRCLVETSEKKGVKRKIQKVIDVLRYKASMRDKVQFVQYKRNYAKQYYPLLGIRENEMNYAPELDILVIGSDEVFNCVQSNTNVGYSRELFGHGSNASKVVSYAASFGNTTLEKIEQYHIAETLKMDLEGFYQISVRDRNSQEIIKALTGNVPVVHLDPVLIYDWKQHIPDGKPIEEKYMVVYGYSGRFSLEECRYIKDFALKYGLKVICIGGIQNIKDTFVNCSPFEVLQYFANAEYVVTDTFHGTIMSMIMQRKFAAFVRRSGYGNCEKLIDLLSQFKVTQRKVMDSADLEKTIMKDIDYLEIDFLLKEQREKSYQYLRRVLE